MFRLFIAIFTLKLGVCVCVCVCVGVCVYIYIYIYCYALKNLTVNEISFLWHCNIHTHPPRFNLKMAIKSRNM